MIGSITTADGRQATLGDDGVWESDSPPMAVFLNAAHSPLKQPDEAAISRALPFWGHDQLRSAAAFYGTEPTITEHEDETDEAVVY